MQLVGWSLLQLLAVLGTASAITVALYLLKLRRRAVPVPFIGLWESLLADRQSSRLFSRLRHLLSLLIALLIVALLAFARADPAPVARADAAPQRLVLVDAGLSMQANDVPGGRLAAAREVARGLLAAARPERRTMLAQLDGSVTPLSSWSDEPHALERALEQLAASDLQVDHQQGYRFALDVLAGAPGSELVLISDAARPPEPELAASLARADIALRYAPVGKRGDNVAITAFAVRRYPLDRNQNELLIELHNASSHVERAELRLIGDGAPIDVQHLELQPGQTLQRTYGDVTGIRQTLQAELVPGEGHDDLAADDRAYAVVPERRRVRVLCVSDGNRYLEAALLLDEYLDVDAVTPAAYRGAGAYDVVVFDRFVPAAPPGKPSVFIAPAGSGPAQPLAVTGTIDRPLFERVQSKHALLRFTALRDVNVASALAVRLQPGDSAIAGDPRGPLIVAGTRHEQPFVALTFELHASDLPLRAAWPLLLLNAIDSFSADHETYASSSSVGEPVAVQLPANAQDVRVVEPGGSERSLSLTAGGTTFTPTRAGLYRVHWQTSDPAGRAERWLAVNLAAETRRDLTPAKALRVGGTQVAAPVRESAALPAPIWALLVLAALLVLSAEWLSYHRRWTV
jgi:hypothetical protein